MGLGGGGVSGGGLAVDGDGGGGALGGGVMVISDTEHPGYTVVSQVGGGMLAMSETNRCAAACWAALVPVDALYETTVCTEMPLARRRRPGPPVKGVTLVMATVVPTPAPAACLLDEMAVQCTHVPAFLSSHHWRHTHLQHGASSARHTPPAGRHQSPPPSRWAGR